MSSNEFHEVYTEYRLTWTYPYLKNQGEVCYAYGKSPSEARSNAMNDEGFYWAGEVVAWHKREVEIARDPWEETRE